MGRPRSILLAVGLSFGCKTGQPVTEPEPLVSDKPPVCAVESPELCLQDGVDHEVGARGAPDPEAAKAKYELACEGGEQRGCTRLGALLYRSEDEFQRARTSELWSSACTAGEPMACAQLGSNLLAQAWSNEQLPDDVRAERFGAARELLRRACDMDEPQEVRDHWGTTPRGYACANLAAVYEHGFAVEQDYDKALELNEQACELGWEQGCAQVGYFHQHGLGVPADLAKAKKIYESSCTAGNEMACEGLKSLPQ